jgi:hypothetical protein
MIFIMFEGDHDMVKAQNAQRGVNYSPNGKGDTGRGEEGLIKP